MGRERHGIEYAAGAGILVGMALLIGNSILRSADQILSGADNANHREETDGNHKRSLAVMSVYQHAIDVRGNGVGEIVYATAAMAAAIGLQLDHLCAENNGVYHLNNGGRNVLDATARLGNRAKVIVVGVASEHADVTVTAVKNNVLLYHGNAVKFLRATCTNTSLKGQLDIKSNRYGIKAAIKANRIDTNKRPRDAGILNANG